MIDFEQYKNMKYKTFPIQREYFHELCNNRNQDFEYCSMDCKLSRRENSIFFNDIMIGEIDEIKARWPYMQMRIKVYVDGRPYGNDSFVYWNFYKE